MASGYVSNKSTYYSCRAKRGKNITSIPHDEVVQISNKSFDEKVWIGLTELLNDPENIKGQLEKRLHTKKAKLPASLPAQEFDKELVKLEAEENRMLEAYREAVISIEQLKAQNEIILNKRNVLEAKKKAIPSHTERTEQPKITMDMLGDISASFQRVMAKASFETREKLTHLLINSVILSPHKAVVSGNIPLISLDALIPTAASR